MPAKGQTSDTVLTKWFYDLLQGSSRPRGPFQRETLQMMFALFALAIAADFFGSSLILLNYGRHLGLRYLQQKDAANMAGLTTVEGAVFALIGLPSGSTNADNWLSRRQTPPARLMTVLVCSKVMLVTTCRLN